MKTKINKQNIHYRLRHWDLYLINILGLGLGICFYYIFGQKIEIIVACLAATISISTGLRQYKVEEDKIFKELFEKFNNLYDEKFNERLNEIVDNTLEVDEKLIVDYLNFCSEEYLWFRKHRIPYVVWSAWKEGILFHLRKEPIKRIAEKERIQKESYYGLFEALSI
ncbi:hypothetical protein [Salmonirosea aquatica]|uniref:SLATT domain-containing protein n=1 Tax=Salmonirosea aquatica TaxID=2654236 RepID=A0A7C9BMF3_9BACT|nr:hypothetical protein [Cytophagaceae bacterium SJW1-29]